MSSTIELGTSIKTAKSATQSAPGSRASASIYIPGAGLSVKKDYNTLVVEELDELKQASIEGQIAKGIGMALVKCYPNRQWGVEVDISGRMINVRCPSLSLKKAHYISMVGRSNKDLVAAAVMAAGEILERYGVSRAVHFNPDHLETLARDAQDEVISSDAAPEPIHKTIQT